METNKNDIGCRMRWEMESSPLPPMRLVDSPCYRKMRRPGCWRCSQRKIGCSMVEAQKRKNKGKETEERNGENSGKERREDEEGGNG